MLDKLSARSSRVSVEPKQPTVSLTVKASLGPEMDITRGFERDHRYMSCVMAYSVEVPFDGCICRMGCRHRS